MVLGILDVLYVPVHGSKKNFVFYTDKMKVILK